jgi:cytochrome o ubiquinol oxidase subunit 2
MRFKFHGVNQQGFDQWVAQVREKGTALNRDTYLKLERPSEREPVRYFSTVDKDLFNAILNMCAAPGQMCMNEMMHIDRMGGGGKESAENREKLLYDNRHSDQAGGGHETPAGESPDASETKPADAQNGAGQSGDTQTMPGMQHDGHTMPGMDHGTGSDPAPAQSNSN